MKILSLAQIDMSQSDGRVTHLLDLAKAFRQNNVTTDVIVISSKPSVIQEEHLKIYVLPKILTFWLIEGIICNLLAWFIITLKAKHYDRIYIRHHSNLALALKFAFTKKLLWIEVNGLFKDENIFRAKTIGWRFKNFMGIFLEKLSFKKANHIFCVTSQLKEKIINNYSIRAENISFVSNGVDLIKYCPMDKNKCRKQLGLNNDYIYIGFIGSFIGWAGIDTFLNILPKVMLKHEKMQAIIVGNGENFEEYNRLAENLGIKSKVIFPGQVHSNIAPIWINTFDIGVAFIKPKGHGLSPIKLYSYMACGIPIVASNLEGFEPVKEYNAGILVQKNIEIQNALEKLITEENLRIEMGQNGRRCAEKLFSWEITAKKIISTN